MGNACIRNVSLEFYSVLFLDFIFAIEVRIFELKSSIAIEVNAKIYSANLDLFSIAIEFLTTKDSDSARTGVYLLASSPYQAERQERQTVRDRTSSNKKSLTMLDRDRRQCDERVYRIISRVLRAFCRAARV